MPGKVKHLNQYERNKALSNSVPLTNDENRDWRITLMFYAAIHLLEASYSNLKHNKTHSDRKDFLKVTNPYNSILTDYESLEALSRKARYDCFNIRQNQLEVAQKNMDNIEQFVNTLESTKS